MKPSKGWLDKSGGVTNLMIIIDVDLLSCESECTQLSECVAYTYITSMKQCNLKDQTGIGGGFSNNDDFVAGKKPGDTGNSKVKSCFISSHDLKIVNIELGFA